MKLLFSIVTTSMACGFFAGRFVSGPFCWAIGGTLMTCAAVCAGFIGVLAMMRGGAK